MKYLYLFVFSFAFHFTVNGQLSKPLHKPNPSAKIEKHQLKLSPTAEIGIPKKTNRLIPSFQPTTLPAFRRKMHNEGFKVTAYSKEGRPTMIKGELPNTPKGRSLDLQVFDYLEALKRPLQIENPREEFKLVDKINDDLGQTHFRMDQYYKGVKIYGGQLILHGAEGKINLINGRNHPTPALHDVQPKLNAEQAKAIAIQDVSLKTTVKELTGLQKRLVSESHLSQLVIYEALETKAIHLAWHLKFHANLASEWEYFVDAKSGKVIDAYKTLCQLHHNLDEYKSTLAKHQCEAETEMKPTIPDLAIQNKSTTGSNGPATAFAADLNNFNRTVHSYELNGNFFMIDASRPMYNPVQSSIPNEPIGAIWTIDAGNTFPENNNFSVSHVVTNNNRWDEPIPVSAHFNAGVAYSYFNDTFGRNSINGRGGTIVSIVNVSDEDGSGLDNAFWSGSAMFYGNGGQAFAPLAKALDVAGHEIAHGVVQNTANLRYQGESGAMNESYSDVFGVLIDRDDYLLGEDVVNPNIFRSGALRNMADPNNGGTRLGDPGYQPANVSEQFFGSQDNGGVHINSGITNRAFFLVANTIGRDRAEQIYYRALTTYLVATSQFVDLRASLLQSATDIHGANSNEVSIVGQAFDAVGILGPDTGAGNDSGGAEDIEFDPNPGRDFVLYTNDAQSSLLVADGNGDPLIELSNNGVLSKPSITDDGTEIVYVGLDQRVYLITIDWPSGGTFTEEIIADEPIWRNAIISRQGNLIGLLDAAQDNTINVFDRQSGELRTFELFNPTFTEGISTGEVDFADVIEFDFSGEFIMYDAQNFIRTNFDGGIIYYDIGFIKVYDNETRSFETNVNNNIFKLFAGLPENISIGNPTFSKNTPNIIAYELIDQFNLNDDYEQSQIFEIRGLDLLTYDEGIIFSGLNLQYPSYSRLDDRIIFNFFNDEAQTYSIGQVPLAEDKINRMGEDAFFFIDEQGGAQFGVWFSEGIRTLTSTNELETAVTDFQVRPNPFTNQFTLELSVEENTDVSLEVTNTLGQQLFFQNTSLHSGLNRIPITLEDLTTGTYFVSLKSDLGIVSKKVVKY